MLGEAAAVEVDAFLVEKLNSKVLDDSSLGHKRSPDA
jgi:hypothetical protein